MRMRPRRRRRRRLRHLRDHRAHGPRAPSRDFVAELPRSWLILGDAQFYRGYCVLFAKRHVTEMHLMPRGEARALFDEMIAVGKTLERVVKPLKLNYECLGNLEPHVHWHVFPRFESDPMRAAPVWMRPEPERKVTLEDSDRRGLIQIIGAEAAAELVRARADRKSSREIHRSPCRRLDTAWMWKGLAGYVGLEESTRCLRASAADNCDYAWRYGFARDVRAAARTRAVMPSSFTWVDAAAVISRIIQPR